MPATRPATDPPRPAAPGAAAPTAARAAWAAGAASPSAGSVPAGRPLLVCGDERLLEDLLGLAAEAGVEPVVAADPGAARQGWCAAPLVLVGDDLSERVADAGLPRRDAVVLVSRDLDDPQVWQRAVRLGAANVAFLPDGRSWLVDALVDALADAPRCVAAGTVVGVLGGRGGAGASALACALGIAAARAGMRTVLVDGDPLGGGLDLVLGGEDVPGLRWPDVARARGRVAPADLSAGLPSVHSLLVLSWDRCDVLDVDPPAMRSVLLAASGGADLVIVDLPRRPDPASRVALALAERTYLVVPAEVRAVASAARVAALVGPLTGSLRLVVRGPAPTGLDASVVAGALALPLAGYCRAEPGLGGSLDRGDPPGARPGPLATLARRLLAELPVAARRAR